MIVLKNVSKNYGDGRVLENVSLEIGPGEFVCVTGQSGAGKTTLLSLLMGAEDVTNGSVMVDGVDLRTVPAGALQIFRRRVGIVFQDYKLLQNRTVAENIAFPLEVCGASDLTIDMRVTELLKTMELVERMNALPRELSGGEKARTAIARAIAHKPLILLADEPTQNLDPDQARDVLQIFRDINKSGTTVIFATHDAALVDALNTRVIELKNGKIIRDSVGGYRDRETKPKVVEERIDPETEREKAVNDAVERVTGRRKVRVTAIHSD